MQGYHQCTTHPVHVVAFGALCKKKVRDGEVETTLRDSSGADLAMVGASQCGVVKLTKNLN
jgi:hypothetical protein